MSSAGIGIMESQHRKVTYRMKRRGMYWSKKGAEAMSRMIVLDYQNELRDLFFGDWREEYEKFKSLPTSLGEFLKESPPETFNSTIDKHISDKAISKAIK